MNKRKIILLSVAVIMLVAAFSATAFATGDAEAVTEAYKSRFHATFWALLPPVVAILLALITKEVYSSLFVGIVTGALLYANFNVELAFNTMISDGFITKIADAWNVGILIFLVVLGMIVVLVNQAGGSKAYGR